MTRPLFIGPRQSAKAFVLGVLGMLAGVFIFVFGLGCCRCAHVNAQLQATVCEIGTIMDAARQNYGMHGYSGLTTAVAIGARVIPDARVDIGGVTATNRYAGAITLVDNSARMAGTAVLSYAGVPGLQCARMVAAVQSRAREIDVQGVAVKRVDGSVDAASLGVQCATPARVKIDFIFGSR